MTEAEITEIFRETGVIREGHFLLTSGRHSPIFLQCSQVLQYPRKTELLAADLAARHRDRGIQVVLGPAMGGVILAYEVARQLGARALYLEKGPEGGMLLRRGFKISPGERVLVVEDAITTGGSVLKTIEAIRPLGVEIVGVGALVDRSGGGVDLGYPLSALLTLEIPSHAPEDCPQCRAGVPLERPKL